jgi:hypothetical protein
MQVTVTIPDELAAQVKARGITPESFVSGLIEDAARANPLAPKRRTRDMKAFFKAMAAHSEKVPELPDEAFTRESFYQDHD